MRERTDINDVAQAMQRYYAVQSYVYDATRWAYLFGRSDVVASIPGDVIAPYSILEIGCGTGFTLRALAHRFPNASITAYDASSHMVQRARQAVRSFGARVQVRHAPYKGDEAQSYDIVLMSYSLSMMQPFEDNVLASVARDLRPGGVIAVVDFESTQWSLFRSAMAANHVRMDGFMMPLLSSRFRCIDQRRRSAYGGLWNYLTFIGRNDA
ncbi:MAG: class I SAM-dependent methyltransferase [Candidatus Kapabacteria bacterium]|nr:class I SAM-dependent methyltransferase [Candidatus Kapabacteria bacterium]